MEVKLISYTANPELLSAAAARLCYRDISAGAILDTLSESEIDRLLDIVTQSGHHSVLEHVTFTFAIDRVSRILTHQLVRHRVGIAFSQQSQRYTRLKDFEYVLPISVSNRGMSKRFDELVTQCTSFYDEMLEAGVPKEDARFIFNQAISTRIVMTANIRQLIHMYNINACFRSQWEFRELMRLIKVEVRAVSEKFGNEMVIKCFAMGYCNETYICDELKETMPRKEDVQGLHRRGEVSI